MIKPINLLEVLINQNLLQSKAFQILIIVNMRHSLKYHNQIIAIPKIIKSLTNA